LLSFTARELAEITGGDIISGSPKTRFRGVSIDSRKISRGGLFIAIKGEKKNGHLFVEEAIEKGSAAVLLSERESQIKRFLRNRGPLSTVIKVPDSLRALQDLAGYQREKYDIPVIGITGSNGKSSVKEMAASILSQRYRVSKNEGNLNNHIGLPLTLLGLAPSHEVAILEMGMSGIGEIRRLCEIARPRCGVVTNVGAAHLEHLGSVRKILDAKRELIDFLGPGDTAVLNADGKDFEELRSATRGRVISFGIRNKADYQAGDIVTKNSGTQFVVKAHGRGAVPCEIGVPGRHNVYNALCAVAISGPFRMRQDEILRGLEDYRPLSMRMEVLKWRKVTLINDAYNANPDSMKAAIQTLAERSVAGKKILVTGDMLELGDYAESSHREIGRRVAEKKLDFLVTFGDLASWCGKSAIENGLDPSRVRCFHDSEDIAVFLKDLASEGDCLLFKGSRGMGMEKIIKKILEN